MYRSNRLGIGKAAPDWTPSTGSGLVTLEVDDFAAAIERLKK
jgi:hypothetical protein